MAKKTSLKQLSSEELFELAQQRKQEEEAMLKEAKRAEMEALKAERKQILARHKKELAAIEAKIAKLGGRSRRTGGRGSNIAEAVLAIVNAYESVSTAEIKAELEAQGVIANNLSQTLAYLKRQGRVTSPSRSVYAPA